MTPQHPDSSGGSGLHSLVKARVAPTGSHSEATGLKNEARSPDGTPIVDLVDRCEASVCGVVRSVSVRPRAKVPALVAEIYDGSRALNLIFLGRRRIGGVAPGTYLSAHGRVTYQTGTPTIFNPAYEIRPDRGR
jgi:hypothetical protein